MKRNTWILLCLVAWLVGCTTAPTTDLYTDAQRARATAESALQVAEYQERFLTATAQAPIVNITETAAGLIVMQTQRSVDQTSVAALWTPTATMVPSITPSPTANATGTMMMVYVALDATKASLEIERAQTTNKARALGGYTVALVALILSVACAYVLIRRLSFMPNPVSAEGKAMPMISVVDGVAWDIERATNGMVGTAAPYLKQLPMITADRQDVVTARSQMVDMATRARLPKRLLDEQMKTQLALPEGEDTPLLIDYPLPDWAWMKHWQPGQIALGINEKGLLQVDPDINPHILFAGTTGSWKTRGGMRVAVSCALASGWQVIIAGKPLDYKVFETHPNAYMIQFSLLSNPLRAIELLRSVYGEIERRDQLMSKNGHSLWSQTGRTRTMVVVDEFSNLADALEDIDNSRREELWRWARMCTAEARKYGLHMLYALQDPTAKSIDLRIRRNTTPVMFRVKDATSSRTLLNVGGAELLAVRHFLASISKLERGAAFGPEDSEILTFLASHPVRADDQPEWIDAVVSDVPTSLESDKPAALPEPTTLQEFMQSLSDLEAEIIDLHIEGKSNRQIEIEKFGSAGGQAYTKVSQLVRRYRALNSDATTTTSPKMPNLGAVAA